MKKTTCDRCEAEILEPATLPVIECRLTRPGKKDLTFIVAPNVRQANFDASRFDFCQQCLLGALAEGVAQHRLGLDKGTVEQDITDIHAYTDGPAPLCPSCGTRHHGACSIPEAEPARPEGPSDETLQMLEERCGRPEKKLP